MRSKPCRECGKVMTATPVHLAAKTYCSKACMAKGYASRLKGAGNPHFSDAAKRTCNQCGDEYLSYNKSRQFCSDRCKGKTPSNLSKLKAMALLPRKPREVLGRRCTCKHCGVEFRSGSRRGYCNDHREIGLKARGSNSGRKDINHDAIVEALIAAGASVVDTHQQGGGMPDLVVARGDRLLLFEVKNPGNSYGRKGFSASQRKWASEWQGSKPVIVRTVAEALRELDVGGGSFGEGT